jgi:hypothetical protein
MFTCLSDDIYENLVGKTVGLSLSSLLGSSSSSIVDASSFVCVVSLSLYLGSIPTEAVGFFPM